MGLSRGDRAGGLTLTLAAVGALAWANWPGNHSYLDLWMKVAPWSRPLGLDFTVRDWVNQGLLLGFFALIGLEIRREITAGELRSLRRAIVPVVAAMAGMATPALIYALGVAGGPGARGWGIPMATDVAFALGALALIGGTSARARVFLMTLAVADDIGSVIVLVVVYGRHTRFGWLMVGLLALTGLVIFWVRWRRFGWLRLLLVGVAWWAMLHAGVEAAVIGVTLGVFGPRRQSAPSSREPSAPPAGVRAWVIRLEPVVNVVILPVFALANVGIVLSGPGLASGPALRVFVAVVLARLIGKPLGITVATLVLVHFNKDIYQPRIVTRSLVGIGSVASIGFTVPLLIIQLALPTGPIATAATAGLLAASVLGAGAGAVILRAHGPSSISPMPKATRPSSHGP
ncbi:MAG: Na+/H+ antiporter NhaA [Acidimicrobiales bacterium]